MVVLKKQVSGSTLFEALVSLAIIMIVVTIGLVSYFQILKSSISNLRVRAQLILNQEIIQVQKQQSFVSEQYEQADFLIKKEVLEYSDVPGVYCVQLSAQVQEEIIATKRKVLIVP